jgi:predicted porin
MADVTIYGSIRGGIESDKTYAAGVDASGKPASTTEVEDWTSRIGFKGNEDLGNGLKTIWQVESRLHIDGTGADTLGTRDTFIGLAGNFGSVRLGKLSNFANSDMEQVDPGYYSGKSVGGLGMFTRLDGRVTNAIRYDSPNFSGFSGSLLWGADESRTVVGGDRTNNQTYNIGLSYENAGFFGKYNYEHWGDADKVASTDNWHRLEVGYNANNIYVALGYQRVQTYNLYTAPTATTAASGDYFNPAILTALGSASIKGTKATTKEWALTGGYTFGALTPYLSYVQGKDVDVDGIGTIGSSGYKQWVLGANYDLSKRTSAYASYGHVKWDASGVEKESSFGVGLIHNF